MIIYKQGERLVASILRNEQIKLYNKLTMTSFRDTLEKMVFDYTPIDQRVISPEWIAFIITQDNLRFKISEQLQQTLKSIDYEDN